jgi:beta-galactosidase
MHAGLNRPDNVFDVGGREAAQVAHELGQDWWQSALQASATRAPAAIVFDYESAWIARIQPQGASFDYLTLVYNWYSELRRHGVDVDIVPPGAPLDGYRLAVVPMLAHIGEAAAKAFADFDGVALFGIRSGSKTESFQIPKNMPPDALQRLLSVRITRVESLRPGTARSVLWGNQQFSCEAWVEHVDVGEGVEALAAFADGKPALVRKHNRYYLAAGPSKQLIEAAIKHLLDQGKIPSTILHDDVRIRRRGALTFAFNFGSQPQRAPTPSGARFVLGSENIAPYDLAVWA